MPTTSAWIEASGCEGCSPPLSAVAGTATATESGRAQPKGRPMCDRPIIARSFPSPFDPTVERPDILLGEPGGIADLQRLSFAARLDIDPRRHAVLPEKARDRVHAP